MLVLKWETWKKIKDTDLRVSNLGRFKRNGKIIQPLVSNTGYNVIKCGSKLVAVHRLVVETFIGGLNENDTIDHKDGNRRNNSVDNLEIVSREENQRRAKEQLCNMENKIGCIYNGSKIYNTLYKAAKDSLNERGIKKVDSVTIYDAMNQIALSISSGEEVYGHTWQYIMKGE